MSAHEGPCALDVFREAGYTPDKAHEMAMTLTCYPMDCRVASEQAREAVRRLKAGATMNDLLGEVEASMFAAAGAGPKGEP